MSTVSDRNGKSMDGLVRKGKAGEDKRQAPLAKMEFCVGSIKGCQ